MGNLLGDIQSKFFQLCTPSQFYLVLALLKQVLFAVSAGKSLLQQNVLMNFLIMLLFIFVWAWILNWFCRDGFTPLSWTLVLLPIVIEVLPLLGKMLKGHQLSQPDKVNMIYFGAILAIATSLIVKA